MIYQKIYLERETIKFSILVKGSGTPFFIVPWAFLCYNVSMKTKNIIKTGLVVAGLGALAFGAKKVADDHKLMKTQEELTAIVRDYFSEMGEIGTLYVQVYESSLERLVGGVIFEDGRHYTFVYEDEDLIYEEEVLWFLLKI